MIGDFENKDVFLGKANLMMKRILHAVTLGEISTIQHFMKDSIYQKIVSDYEKNSSLGQKSIYDEVNVKSNICRVVPTDEGEDVEVLFSIRAIHYFVNMKTQEIIGDNNSRKEFAKRVLFTKRRDSIENEVPRCLGCGSTVDYYQNGICPNCGRVFDFELFDYIIKEMDW